MGKSHVELNPAISTGNLGELPIDANVNHNCGNGAAGNIGDMLYQNDEDLYAEKDLKQMEFAMKNTCSSRVRPGPSYSGVEVSGSPGSILQRGRSTSGAPGPVLQWGRSIGKEMARKTEERPIVDLGGIGL